jgi:DNA-binding NarL/FixJ family response regulator
MNTQEAKQEGLTIIRPNLPHKEGICPDLPAVQRAVFLLYVGGLKINTISALLRVKKSTIRVYVSMSRKIYPKAKRQ